MPFTISWYLHHSGASLHSYNTYSHFIYISYYYSISFSSISSNPNPYPSLPPIQLHNILLWISKLGFDNFEEALNLFHQMVKMQPLPSFFEFTQLLSAFVKIKVYSVLIIVFRYLCIFNNFLDIFTVHIIISDIFSAFILNISMSSIFLLIFLPRDCNIIQGQ